MQRRLLALVLGLFVAGAPQALAACQFACFVSNADSVASEGHHGRAGHQAFVPVSAAALGASPHACDHADQYLAVTWRSPEVNAPPAILTTTAAFSLPLETTPADLGAFQQRPPGHVILHTPLRL